MIKQLEDLMTSFRVYNCFLKTKIGEYFKNTSNLYPKEKEEFDYMDFLPMDASKEIEYVNHLPIETRLNLVKDFGQL